jgi:hypothetical protein
VTVDESVPVESGKLSPDEILSLRAAKTTKERKKANTDVFALEAGDEDVLRTVLEDRIVDEPPNATFSHRAVQRMAQLGVPDKEIARVLGVGVEALKAEANEALTLGRTIGNVQLRMRQYAAAMQGDKTLLVWLGKQNLGQMDKVAQEVSGPNGSPIEHRHAVMSVRAKLEAMLGGSEPAPLIETADVLALPPVSNAAD